MPEEGLYPVPEEEPDLLPEDESDTFYEEEPETFYEDESGSASAAKLVAEHQSGIEPSSSVIVASKDELLASYDVRSSVAASDGNEAAAPVPRRPMILLACLMAATVALVLLLKSCFVTPGDSSYPQGQQPTIKSVGQAIAPTPVTGDQLKAAKIKSTTPAFTSPDRVMKPDIALQRPSTNNKSDGQQNLEPIVVEAGLRRLIPVNVAKDSLSAELSADIGEREREEVASRNFAVKEGRSAVSTEIVVEQRWQETMLVSFSFDSDELAPDSHGVLDRVAAILRENVKSRASITGFTDSRGDSQYNLRLSRKRANAVERYLVDAGIARERLRVVGGGVLANPIAGLAPGLEDPMEPYRIVQIKLVSEG